MDTHKTEIFYSLGWPVSLTGLILASLLAFFRSVFLVFKITDTAIKLNQGQTKKSWRWEQGEKAVLEKNQLHSTPWDFWNLFARGQSKWHSWLWPTECQPASRCEIPNGYSIGCMVACNVWPDILLTWDKKKLTIVYTVYICIYIYYIFTSLDVKEVCSSKTPKIMWG